MPAQGGAADGAAEQDEAVGRDLESARPSLRPGGARRPAVPRVDERLYFSY